MRSDGFAVLHDLLQLQCIRKMNATEEMVREIVESDDKQRFAMLDGADGKLLIRANQGHSMDGIDMDELCGSPVSQLRPGEVCCHGTYMRHLESILEHGLKAGGNQGQAFRKDVHFSVGHPGEEVVSGMRLTSQIVIYVDLPKAAAAGIRFYRSANDVILSEGVDGAVPPEYIESVWDIKEGVQLHPASKASAGGEAYIYIHIYIYPYTYIYIYIRSC